MRINWYRFGRRGKKLVFLHGWQQDGRSFLPLVPFLHRHFQLFFVDLPGFGASSSPPKNFNSQKYAQTILSWLKKQKLNKIVLVGHSFGGKVAAILAAQHPEKVKKLILIAPAGIPHPKWWYPLKDKIPKKVRRLFSPFKKFLTSRDYQQAGPLLPIFKTVVKEDITPVFRKIKTPTLIIWGSEDKELPLSDGKLIHQLIPTSQLKVIKKADHFPFWRNPKRTAEIIQKFLKTNGQKTY